MRYQIRNREAGTMIDEVEALEEAKGIVEVFENMDKNEEIYEEGFYEIYDSEEEKIVD